MQIAKRFPLARLWQKFLSPLRHCFSHIEFTGCNDGLFRVREAARMDKKVDENSL